MKSNTKPVGQLEHFLELHFVPSGESAVQFDPETESQHFPEVLHQLVEASRHPGLPIMGFRPRSMKADVDIERSDFLFDAEHISFFL